MRTSYEWLGSSRMTRVLLNHSININMDTEWYFVCLKVSLIFAPWWGWIYLNDGHVQLSGKMVGSEDVRASCKIGLNFATSKMCKSGSQFEACTMTEVAYSHLSSGPTSSSYTRKIHFVHSSKRSTHEVLLTQILNLGLYRIFFFFFRILRTTVVLGLSKRDLWCSNGESCVRYPCKASDFLA